MGREYLFFWHVCHFLGEPRLPPEVVSARLKIAFTGQIGTPILHFILRNGKKRFAMIAHRACSTKLTFIGKEGVVGNST